MIDKCLNLYKKNQELINYLIFGILTTIVNLATKYLLLFTILDATKTLELQLAIILSWILAVAFAYITNRRFVFESKNNNVLKELIDFFNSRITTLLLEMLIIWFFITYLQLNSDTLVIIITILSQILVIIANYVLSKLFVFKKKK